jgi:hypothetical protein
LILLFWTIRTLLWLLIFHIVITFQNKKNKILWKSLGQHFFIHSSKPKPYRVNRPMIEHLSAQGRPDPRAPLFSVAKWNLNSYWCIWHNKNCLKWNKIEKVTASQSKEGQELKKQTTECYKGRFSNTKKILCMLLQCS